MSKPIWTLPSWARREVYEYDLGMGQHCNGCGNVLEEGQAVWRDVHTHRPVERYCSVKCVIDMEAPDMEAPDDRGWFDA